MLQTTANNWEPLLCLQSSPTKSKFEFCPTRFKCDLIKSQHGLLSENPAHKPVPKGKGTKG